VVTPAIVAVNAVVFVLMVIDSGAIFSPDGETLMDWGANFGPLTLDGQWWRLLTCTFVHIGLIHIGLNMWVLWDVGQLIERLTGNAGFLLLYVLSGLSGSLASVYWNSNVLSAGASGAVFGAFGGLMGFVLLRGDSIPKSILGRLRASGSSFLFYNLIFGLAIPGIDMAAHVGGFVAGFVCGLVLSQPLDRVTRLTRTWRNMVMAVLGTASLAVALSQAPAAPVDLRSRALRFSAVETRALDTYNDAVRQYQNGKLSEDEFARTIETQVLPPWRAARQEFEQIDVQRVAADSRESLAKLKQYLLLREQAWEAMAAGLKENDPRRLEEAKEKNAAADQLGRQVGTGD
jgi:rhomboid protease GluP